MARTSNNSQLEDKFDNMVMQVFSSHDGVLVLEYLTETYGEISVTPRNGEQAMYLLGQLSVIQDIKERMANG